MDAIAILGAIVLGALLAVRERIWRRRQSDLRRQLVATAVQIREHEGRVQVGALVSGLAQELKSPLQGVLGNTEVMLASGGPGSASPELREIQENATRAVGIVRNLLAFTETAALARRWLDINDLAARAVDAVRGELDASGVHVQLALADRLPLMYVDGRQLEKVIATLLSRPGLRPADLGAATTLTLATRRSDPDDRLVITIDDRSADVDEHIWSADLAACRQIVQAHGGSLEVERAANEGFRFHLAFPVTAVADTALAS